MASEVQMSLCKNKIKQNKDKIIELNLDFDMLRWKKKTKKTSFIYLLNSADKKLLCGLNADGFLYILQTSHSLQCSPIYAPY